MKSSCFFLFALLFLVMISFSSCLHKSVTEDPGDDVEKAVIISEGNKKYLVVAEQVFQAISKSSGRGVTHIAGYNDSRISCYDLSSGTLVARQPLSEYTEKKATLFLGITPGNIWFYSVRKEKGIFSLDPLTLAPKATWEEIVSANSSLKDHIASPKWYEAEKYFTVDPQRISVLLTDNRGYRYRLDPLTLKADPVPDSIFVSPVILRDYFTTSVPLDPSTVLQFNGGVRQKIDVNYKKTSDTLSFLGGKFILFKDPDRIRISHTYRDQLLQPDSADFFIAHKSNTDKDARLMISRIHLERPASLILRWTVEMNDIFYDPNDARETSAFKLVFSKGSPDFDFQFFSLADRQLIVIYMLRAFSIDTETGKLMWMREL